MINNNNNDRQTNATGYDTAIIAYFPSSAVRQKIDDAENTWTKDLLKFHNGNWLG